jgi:hypothetical protein
MDKATRQMLNDGEQDVIRLLESKRFARLDEDQLLDLHSRTRRIRNKYRMLYRRRGAAKVGKARSRALATKSTRRTALKAELFEDALATVSARLAKVAAANARTLRAERLAAARAVKKAEAKRAAAAARKKATARKKTPTKGAAKKKAVVKKRGVAKKKAKTPASKRATASTRAATKRKQAKRDKR